MPCGYYKSYLLWLLNFYEYEQGMVNYSKVEEHLNSCRYNSKLVENSYYISELLTIPEKMQKILEDKERIQWFAAKYANAHDVFFVGRGIDYAVWL